MSSSSLGPWGVRFSGCSEWLGMAPPDIDGCLGLGVRLRSRPGGKVVKWLR